MGRSGCNLFFLGGGGYVAFHLYKRFIVGYKYIIHNSLLTFIRYG